MKPVTPKLSPVVPTRSMFPLGRRIVTLHPDTEPFCEAVPPGHSALSNTPPLLLLIVNVKFCVPQHTPLGVHVPDWHVSAPSQLCPLLQADPFGSFARQLLFVSSQDSLQFTSPSTPAHGFPG